MRPHRLSTALSVLTAVASLLGSCAIVVGGMLTLIGAVMPWAKAQLFGSIHISIPGLFFMYGGLAAACGGAALIFRRSPIVTIVIGIILIVVTNSATRSIPHSVRHELIGAQLSFLPLNQLLDQFHIEGVTVSNYGAKDEEYLGDGLQRTAEGANLILVGSLLSMLRNPQLRKIRRRLTKQRCRACRATWPTSRDALFCPKCSAPTLLASQVCFNCRNPLAIGDRYCIHCGMEAKTT